MKTVSSLSAILLVGALFALAGSVALGLAQGPEPPEQGLPQGDLSLEATVASKFSYQGLLREDGNPVTGSRDLTFRLFEDEGCSTQVGDDIDRPGVQVSNGLFSVELEVTHSHFNGQGLWLEAALGNTRIGCQEILPVPYALSLKPGAIISDTTSLVELNHLRVDLSTDMVQRQGLRAEVTGSHDFAYGLMGLAANSSVSNVGVYGGSEGPGVGVYGSADQGDGVTGISDSGSGVYGHSTDGNGVTGYSANGAAIYGTGDVKQSANGNGLVKAAVRAYCQGPAGSVVDRSFNNVTEDAITIESGPSEGLCAIDFSFDLSARYWVAMAEHSSEGRGVSCQLDNGYPYVLECTRWRADTGAPFAGEIMVLVY
jgi:hypothetical protein